MDLIPQSVEALRALSVGGEGDLETEIRSLADAVVAVVPSCVGMSITVAQGLLTFTLASTSDVAAQLDAVQYATDGPCVTAVTSGHLQSVGDVLDERRWQTYARSAAAAHVRSSLSLPLTREGQFWGAINLYAADPDAFTAHLEDLQALRGVQLARAVTNADLGFDTRQRAQDAPRILEENALVQQAIGHLMAQEGITAEAAEARLQDAAERARVETHVLAKAIVNGQEQL